MNAARESVIEILATWGASALPGAPDLFAALAGLDSRGVPIAVDECAELRALLDRTGEQLDDPLRDELTRLLEEADSPETDAATRTSRLREGMQRLDRGLAQQVASRQKALRSQVEAWSVAMDPGEFSGALDRLWRVDRSREPAERVAALALLDELQGVIERVKEDRTEELRGILEGAGASSLPPEARRAAEAALQSGDPAALARARSSAALAGREDAEAALALRLDAARTKLLELCQDCRRVGLTPDSPLGGSAKTVMATAIRTAEALAASENGLDPASTLACLEIRTKALRALLDDSTGAVASATQHRESAVRALLNGVGHGDGKARGSSDEEEAVIREVLDGSTRNPLAFHEAFLLAVSKLESGRAGSVDPEDRGSPEVRARAAELAEVLRGAAGILPTELVLDSRRLLDRAEAAADELPEERQRLADELASAKKKVVALADRARKAQRGRGQAARQRLLSRVRRVSGIASGREAARLKALASEIEEAPTDALPEIEQELHGVAGPLENAVRLRAARILDGAGDDEAGRLAAALENDDLEEMDRLAESLGGSNRSGLLGGTGGRILPGVLAVVIVSAALLGWRWLGERPREYVLQFETGTGGGGSIAVTLFARGALQHEQNCESSAGATFSLSSGQYEIFVNDQFTGRTISVPDDPSPVTGIPVPTR